jgi:hypothetical protein
MQGYVVCLYRYIGMTVTQQTLTVTSSAVKGQSSTFIFAMDQEREPWKSKSQVSKCLDIVESQTSCGRWRRQRDKSR